MDYFDPLSLLEPSADEKQRAMNMGLLSAGLGILANSRNRGGNLGTALGQGGLHGMQTYNQMLDPTNRMRQAQIAAQVGELQDKRSARDRQQEAMKTLPPEYQQAAAMGVPVADIFKRMHPDYTPQLVETEDQANPGRTLRQWVRPGESAGVPMGVTPRKLPEGMEIGPSGQPQAIPGYLAMKSQIAKAGKPDINTQVIMKQEGEEAKTVGKGFGEAYLELQKGDLSAAGKISRLDRMEQLLNGVNTGKLTPAGTEIAAYAKSIGANIDPNLGNKQAAQALSNELALQMRNPSGGAGMPGALSDADRKFLVESTPGLGKDAESNKLMIETAKKLAQRDRDVAKIARDYRKKNGTLDEGFYEELSKFSERNPLFVKQKPLSVLDAADAILKGR